MPNLRLCVVAILALALGALAANAVAQTTASGTLTATVVESVTTTKTVNCKTITKDSTKVPPEYLCVEDTGGEPPPTGGGGGGAVEDVCTSSDVRINDGWGNSTIETSLYGNFGNNIVSVKVAPPVGWTGNEYSSWVEYGSAPVRRIAIFTIHPCSFDKTKALKNSNGQTFFAGDTNRPSFSYKNGAASTSAAGLTPGQVYYINIRNAFSDGSPSCSIANCGMRGNLDD